MYNKKEYAVHLSTQSVSSVYLQISILHKE